MSRNNRNNQTGAAIQSPEDAEAEAKAQADKEAVEAVEPHHEVAGGTALTSKRGILGARATVVAADLAGGEAAFKKLVEAKKIVYVK